MREKCVLAVGQCGQTQEVKPEFQQCRQSLGSPVRCCHLHSQCCLCCAKEKAVRWSPVAVNKFQAWLCIVNPDWFVNDTRKTVSWLEGERERKAPLLHAVSPSVSDIHREIIYPMLFDSSPVVTIINASGGRMNYVSAKNVHHGQRKNLAYNYNSVINSNTCHIISIILIWKSHYTWKHMISVGDISCSLEYAWLCVSDFGCASKYNWMYPCRQ